MSLESSLGFGVPRLNAAGRIGTEHVVAQHPLRRVMSFLGCSIDEVCNSPIVKNQVFGYYKLYRNVIRAGEISEFERWWNGVGL